MIAVIVEMRELHERCPAKPGRIDVRVGEHVLLSSLNGLETGVVVETEKVINDKKLDMKIIRPLNEDDHRVLAENREYVKKIYLYFYTLSAAYILWVNWGKVVL